MAQTDCSYLIFDIETVPDGRQVQQVRYPDQPDLSPEDAVAKFQAELREESGGKSDFVPATFQLPISVCVGMVDREFRLTNLLTLDRPEFRPRVITQKFWDGWGKCGHPTLVSFNGRGYDLPVLELCAFRYGLSVPAWFSGQGSGQARNRFNQNSHLDLQEFLGNFGAVPMRGGLNLLAKLTGGPGKMDTKGSMVYDLWRAGRALEVDDYCQCDVLDTYRVFLRSRVLTGALSAAREAEILQEAMGVLTPLLDRSPALKAYLANHRVWTAPLPTDTGFAASPSPVTAAAVPAATP